MSLTEVAPAWMDRPDVLAVVFHPRPELVSPGGTKGSEVLKIPVAPGITVGARFYGAEAGREKPTILFFHGNGEIVADYHDLAQCYTAIEVNFLPVGYRGYGLSNGQPTVTALLRDARTVFSFARQWLSDRGYTGPLLVMGRSLGSASALEIASAFPDDVKALIIESGFANAVALLQRLGADLADADSLPDVAFRQERKIAAYAGPTLIIHGTADMVIPAADADALFRASPSLRKQLLKVQGAGHNDLLAVAFQDYMGAVAQLVRAL